MIAAHFLRRNDPFFVLLLLNRLMYRRTLSSSDLSRCRKNEHLIDDNKKPTIKRFRTT